MSLASSAAEPLIFRWEFSRPRKLALSGFLLVSLFVHAAGFYIFQIVYPPTIALLPPPARLNLITPDSEEGRTILRWLEAEDPALASRTQRPAEAKAYVLPKLEHVPSYLTHEPALKEPPPLSIDLRPPTSQPPGAVPIKYSSAPDPMAKPGPLLTTITFSPEIQRLGMPKIVPTKFTASSADPPQAIQFRVAISDQGDVRYCLAANSSGDRALDEQARSYVGLCRFSPKPPGSPPLIWGTATLEWGTDVSRGATSTNISAP